MCSSRRVVCVCLVLVVVPTYLRLRDSTFTIVVVRSCNCKYPTSTLQAAVKMYDYLVPTQYTNTRAKKLATVGEGVGSRYFYLQSVVVAYVRAQLHTQQIQLQLTVTVVRHPCSPLVCTVTIRLTL